MQASGSDNKGRRAIPSALKSFRLAWAWLQRFVKVRFHKCRLCRAKHRLEQRTARLGSEIYSLHRQGDNDFLKSLVVRQQLKIVEEAERQVFEICDRIEEIEQAYGRKKEEVRGEKNE